MRKSFLMKSFVCVATLLCSSVSLVGEDCDGLSFSETDLISSVVSSDISALEGVDVTVDSVELLYDIDGMPTYVITTFSDGGYAIVTRENKVISEYSLYLDSPYSSFTGSNLIYGGYGNYFSTEVLTYSLDDSEFEIIQSANTKMLNQENTVSQRDSLEILSDSYEVDGKPPFIDSDDLNVGWVGIDQNTMARYNWPHIREYVGQTNGICGTVTSTMLLAYYDDYVDNTIVPNVLRVQNSPAPEMLYEVMWYNIDFLHPDGTMPYDLVVGINNTLTTYSDYGVNGYTARYDTVPTMIKAQDFLRQSKPVIMGTLDALGSPYKDHWVLAYAYSTDVLNSYYKVIDTWVGYKFDSNSGVDYPLISANSHAVINKAWTSSFVYIEKV